MIIPAFFTTQEALPPVIEPAWCFALIVSLIFLVRLTIQQRNNHRYHRFFIGLQILQLVGLYGWYVLFRLPLSISLPLYHCRMAMFALLLLPKDWRLKQYFALVGLSGAVMAFVHPVLDTYAFPHLTFFSFFLGHYALFVNCLLYLLNDYDSDRLSFQKIILYTGGINLFLLMVNHLTGGDYGLLRNPPFINGSNIWFNFIVVTSVLVLAILALELFFKKVYVANVQRT
ncbi:YwaF family protein [Streptococcus merionis]|uniref:Major facilitator superfamily permease n=1 Tax=Streptococcus merionis TaxID=400065 RepID=A0A239SQH0_9STRE|nr:TIGR02206 family membrane protein [Streptococcus merionis]SNU86903.1 major facilitator superfamily permease [Streptococcus merionis]